MLLPPTSSFAKSDSLPGVNQRLQDGEKLQELLEERYHLLRRLMALESDLTTPINIYRIMIPRATAYVLLKNIELELQGRQKQFAAQYGKYALVEELLKVPQRRLQVIQSMVEITVGTQLLEQEWQVLFSSTATVSANAPDLEYIMLQNLRKVQIMLSAISGDVKKNTPERILLNRTISDYHQLMRMNMATSGRYHRTRQFSNYPIPRGQIGKWTVAPSGKELVARFTGLFPRNCNNVLAEIH